jgi:hypothetical protein
MKIFFIFLAARHQVPRTLTKRAALDAVPLRASARGRRSAGTAAAVLAAAAVAALTDPAKPKRRNAAAGEPERMIVIPAAMTW